MHDPCHTLLRRRFMAFSAPLATSSTVCHLVAFIKYTTVVDGLRAVLDAGCGSPSSAQSRRRAHQSALWASERPTAIGIRLATRHDGVHAHGHRAVARHERAAGQALRRARQERPPEARHERRSRPPARGASPATTGAASRVLPSRQQHRPAPRGDRRARGRGGARAGGDLRLRQQHRLGRRADGAAPRLRGERPGLKPPRPKPRWPTTPPLPWRSCFPCSPGCAWIGSRRRR